MNPILTYALRVLGGWESVKVLVSEADEIVTLGRGVHEVNVVNGWVYYRPGTAKIVLDDSDYPRAATNATWATPEQPAYLFIEKPSDFRFLVEEGALVQIIQRTVGFD